MSYARLPVRSKYNLFIEEVVNIVIQGNENKMTKGEYLAFFVNRVARLFLMTQDADAQSFNSHLFNDVKRKHLIIAADKVVNYLNKDDPLSSAEEIAYVICGITWGVLGDAPNAERADYGFRCYIKGLLEQVRDGLSQAIFKTVEAKDRVIGLRRFTLIKGVITDAVDETFRRRTAAWLNQRIKDNGDVWEDGKLLSKEQS